MKFIDPSWLPVKRRIKSRSASWRNQLGFTLIEISIVLMIMTILAIGAGKIAAEAAKDGKATAVAAHLKAVKGGTDAYITANYTALIAGTPISGFANIMAPTIAEMKAAGYLGQNISTTPPNMPNITWLTQIVLSPSSCVPPACDLNAVVYSNTGLKVAGTTIPDSYLAALIATKLGGDGGVSLDSNPAIISGENGAWTVANPIPVAGNNQNAAVAMRTGYNSQGLSQFVRQGDPRNITLNGNLDIKGWTFLSGSNNSKTSTTNGWTFLSGATNSGDMTTSGWSFLNGINNSSTLTNQGSFTNNGATWLNGATTTNGKLTATQGISTPSVAFSSAIVTPGAACSPNGLMGLDASNASYTCAGGLWGISAPAPTVQIVTTGSVNPAGCHGSAQAWNGTTVNVTVPACAKVVKFLGFSGAGGWPYRGMSYVAGWCGGVQCNTPVYHSGFGGGGAGLDGPGRTGSFSPNSGGAGGANGGGNGDAPVDSFGAAGVAVAVKAGGAGGGGSSVSTSGMSSYAYSANLGLIVSVYGGAQGCDGGSIVKSSPCGVALDYTDPNMGSSIGGAIGSTAYFGYSYTLVGASMRIEW